MSDLNSSPVTPSPRAARRHSEPGSGSEPLLDGYITIPEIAEAEGCCDRTVRNTADRLNIPFIKVFGLRRYKRDDWRRAIEASKTGRAPRGRGRPRKAARAANQTAA